jgi:hypothetical protein
VVLLARGGSTWTAAYIPSPGPGRSSPCCTMGVLILWFKFLLVDSRVQCPSREKQRLVTCINPVNIRACPYSLLWVRVAVFTVTIYPEAYCTVLAEVTITRVAGGGCFQLIFPCINFIRVTIYPATLSNNIFELAKVTIWPLIDKVGLKQCETFRYSVGKVTTTYVLLPITPCAQLLTKYFYKKIMNFHQKV